MEKQGLIELTLENAEIVIDQIVDNDLLKDIPFVGNAFKVISLFHNSQDRLFLMKLAKFIFSLDEISAEDKNKLKEKMLNNPEEAKEIGSKIILVIDRVTDIEKSEIIANVFLAYIKDQLSANDLRRIIDGIDKAYIDDLSQLLVLANYETKQKDSFLTNMVGTNFVKISGSDKVGEVGELYYELSHIGIRTIHSNKLGKSFRKIR